MVLQSLIHRARPFLPSEAVLQQHSDLRARLLLADDFGAWAGLRDRVIASLPHPDFYVREDDERAFFDTHTEPEGQTLGVFAHGELVAYAMVGFPARGSEAQNLGRTIGLSAAQQGRVAHLSSCMVVPAWRGHGLQRVLLAARLALAQARGRPVCLAMVSLHNHFSRHNLLRQGLHIAWTGTIDGLQRHVAMIDLEHGLHFDPADEILLHSDDFVALRDAAASGYACICEVRGASGVRLRYVRHLHHDRVPW
ncbi:GNAT family N-acetyltransferase [Paracidovorax sp. MALMAid1276]|uniref:GNAT family N-acetyltransferase n=1 Tax=Paracidovorax sp. MALMAid1276 TaxID=3411631 RepID=UPI003B9A46E3